MPYRIATTFLALLVCLCGSELQAAGHPARGGYAAPPAEHCPPPVRYETVVCYEARRVPYAACETRYDECGRPYQVEVTRYRTVRVPVAKRVPAQY